ncbi:hypothetical protein tinsulaeT_04550 [Thalassotalea insulae]|uniref:DUF2059 domain-containing protein n=1 Tax=Thalassotalea insulae TaxID=2056778 RepID=A0ABQ6GM90_9GAMM|nr:hypothetical protein [Thalassotalea insulae]GLX77115.1 hypothetical protein tinsulaeT_04550 [Thalassotalea insulae]
MKNLVMVLCLIGLSINAYAQQALTKELIEQYIKSTDLITPIMAANPALDKQLDDMMMLDAAEIINKLKSTGVYSKVESVVTSAGFDDVEQYLDTSFRIMGAIFNSQLQQLPEGMTLDSYLEQMKGQIKMMKAQGMPQNVISEMEKSISEQLKNMEFMKKAAANVSEDDVKFVSEHLDWLMQLLPSEDESMENHLEGY